MMDEASGGRVVQAPRPHATSLESNDVSRAGAAFFLGDLAFLADAKFRTLARKLPDADEFNSAVGAYWIALAAARRRRSPVIDVGAETGSTYVGVLQEVGLLIEDGFPNGAFSDWGPTSPQQIAGRVRAESAERGEKGQFLPASTSVTSEASAVGSLDKLDQPSLPIPSNQVSSLRNVATSRAPARDAEADAVIEDLQHAEYESSKLADKPLSDFLRRPV